LPGSGTLGTDDYLKKKRYVTVNKKNSNFLVLYHKLIFFYINKYIYSYRACVRLNWGTMGRTKTRQVYSVTVSRRQTPSNTESVCSGDRTLTPVKYREIIEQFLEELHDNEIVNGYFQQDGAPAHTT
jgi:hypothetical protein